MTNMGNTSQILGEALLSKLQNKNAKQNKTKKTTAHTLKRLRQVFGIPNLLFHPFCGISQSNEICKNQNSRLFRKKIVVHLHYSYK